MHMFLLNWLIVLFYHHLNLTSLMNFFIKNSKIFITKFFICFVFSIIKFLFMSSLFRRLSALSLFFFLNYLFSFQAELLLNNLSNVQIYIFLQQSFSHFFLQYNHLLRNYTFLFKLYMLSWFFQAIHFPLTQLLFNFFH